MLTEAQVQQRRKAGLALKAQVPADYYSAIGKRGGRPTFNQALERARERERLSKALNSPGRKKKEGASL